MFKWKFSNKETFSEFLNFLENKNIFWNSRTCFYLRKKLKHDFFWICEQIWKQEQFFKFTNVFEFVNKILKHETFLNFWTNFKNGNIFWILRTIFEDGFFKSRTVSNSWTKFYNTDIFEFMNKFWNLNIVLVLNKFWKLRHVL